MKKSNFCEQTGQPYLVKKNKSNKGLTDLLILLLEIEMKLITEEFEALFKVYPLYSQEHEDIEDRR